MAPAQLDLEPVETEVEKAFVRGLVSLKLGDYERARDEISFVYHACPASPIGARALLTLVTVELDPRNPGQDPVAARRLAERYISLPSKPAWTEPAIETLYLMALDQGGAAESEPDPEAESFAGPVGPEFESGQEIGLDAGPASCEPANGGPLIGLMSPPELPGDPVVEQMAAVTRDRAQLQLRVTQLEGQLTRLQQELQRIRETLKP